MKLITTVLILLDVIQTLLYLFITSKPHPLELSIF